MEKVRVFICIAGDYCAFDEMNFNVEYDITNDLQFGDMTLGELQEFEYNDYCDYKEVDALKIEDKYYVDFDSI